MSVLGDRAMRLSHRLGVVAFGVSIALFESEFLRKLVRLRQKGRAYLPGRRRDNGVQRSRHETERTTQSDKAAKPLFGSAEFPASIPIVFIHQGNSAHLAYSLPQAKTSNPNSTVFLLGDDSNRQYACVEHHPFSDYFVGASEFERVYRHYSTHSRDFELMCFQRWFILREFLSAHHIDKCVYLDSDVLLYANVTDDMAKFRLFDFTVCWNTAGCVCFVNQAEGLERLCEFMMDIYTKTDEYHYDKMVAQFAVRQKHHLKGGATDMTALELYGELNFGRVGEASHIVDGSTYDPNINMPHPGFEMENDIKKIVWQNDQPYGIYMLTGERVRFNSLHFNGHAKALMPRYCTAALNRHAPSRGGRCEEGAVPTSWA